LVERFVGYLREPIAALLRGEEVDAIARSEFEAPDPSLTKGALAIEQHRRLAWRVLDVQHKRYCVAMWMVLQGFPFTPLRIAMGF
jgi:hypothetical protein